MEASDDILGQLQADIAAVLSVSPAMAGARVLVDGDKDFQSRLEKELGTITTNTKGKRGLVIIVAPIAIEEVERNLPGPVATLACRVLCMENLSINRSPRHGTNIPATKAALTALKVLHLRSFGSHALYAGKGAVGPDRVPDGYNAYLVKLTAESVSEPLLKVAQLTATAQGQDVILSTATPDAQIHFTTDGSYPSPQSEVYLSAITNPEVGTRIRAVGYAPEMEPSDVLQFTIKP